MLVDMTQACHLDKVLIDDSHMLFMFLYNLKIKAMFTQWLQDQNMECQWPKSLFVNKKHKTLKFLPEKLTPYKEALSKKEWKTIVDEEYQALCSNHTWLLVMDASGRDSSRNVGG